jgi:hypothetical protein
MFELKFTNDGRGRRKLYVENARIIWPNFSGKAGVYTREGERYFTLLIPNTEIYEALINDCNEYGVGWNVKYTESNDPDGEPFIKMKVKVSCNEYGPKAILISGSKQVHLNGESIGCLDNIDIANVDLVIRAHDGEMNGKPFRSAWLDSIYVTQEMDYFAEKYGNDGGFEE